MPSSQSKKCPGDQGRQLARLRFARSSATSPRTGQLEFPFMYDGVEQLEFPFVASLSGRQQPPKSR